MLLVAHIMTGAVIGLATRNPFLAAISSFATHVALDAIPHWNYPVPKKRSLRAFWRAFGPDMVLSVALAVAVIIVFRRAWLAALWGMGWAAMPDFLTLYSQDLPWRVWLRGFYKLHNAVQWEVARGPGLALQAFFMAVMALVLVALYRA